MALQERTESLPLRGLKLIHLKLMAELRAVGRLSIAAERLGLQQPAASRLLAELEAIIGYPVHKRDGRTLRLTTAGEVFARRAERIQLELNDVSRDMAAAVSGTLGHVRIGSVTGPSLSHLLPVLLSLRDINPDVTIEVVVATSNILCEQVLSGHLDFAFGRIPPSLHDQLALTVLGEEPIALVVRRGHPILMKPVITIEDLRFYDWVMPEDETPLAKTVQRWIANAGYLPPRRWISTSSFLFTLALLKESDALAPLAKAVVDSFTDGISMPFIQIPFVMDASVESYGLFYRKDTDLPPAAARVVSMVLDYDKQIGRVAW